MKKISGSKKGFTLIETIMSIVIISVSVLGLFTIFTTVIAPRNAPQSYEVTKGTQLAQEGLERILADKRSQETGKGFDNIVSAAYPVENLADGYTRTTTIGAWLTNPDTAQYKQVSVQVTRGGRVVSNAVILLAKY